VWETLLAKSLITLRSKRTSTLADTEGKYLTPDAEAKAEPRRRKANKLKAMSRLNAELRLQADEEVQIVREWNTE